MTMCSNFVLTMLFKGNEYVFSELTMLFFVLIYFVQIPFYLLRRYVS